MVLTLVIIQKAPIDIDTLDTSALKHKYIFYDLYRTPPGVGKSIL
jgi:hypothetical protein